MRDSNEMKRPYAPPANVIAVIRRTQQINLPDVIDNDFLRVAQISENLSGRVHDALRFLRLVDESGHPTDTLAAISSASDEEYRSILSAAVQEAYTEDFNRIDPAKDSQAVIVEAFRRYSPRSQTKRMVMMLLGLCREAGIPVLEAPRERKMSGSRMSRTPARRSEPRPSRPREPEPPVKSALDPAAGDGAFFGVTEKDLADLDDGDFAEVWEALGTVARKVARARARPSPSPPATKEAPDEEAGGQI